MWHTSVRQGPIRWILARSNYMDVVLSDGAVYWLRRGKRGRSEKMAKSNAAGKDYTMSNTGASVNMRVYSVVTNALCDDTARLGYVRQCFCDDGVSVGYNGDTNSERRLVIGTVEFDMEPEW